MVLLRLTVENLYIPVELDKILHIHIYYLFVDGKNQELGNK